MNDKNYTSSFLVEKSPEEVFAAINNVRGWWSEEIDGSTDKLGAEFTYHYQDIHVARSKSPNWCPVRKSSGTW